MKKSVKVHFRKKILIFIALLGTALLGCGSGDGTGDSSGDVPDGVPVQEETAAAVAEAANTPGNLVILYTNE